MNAKRKAELLKLIRAGHDVEAAAVAVGASISEVSQPSPKFKAEINAALSVGTARLRGKIMELALGDSDLRVLENLLAHREAQLGDKDAIHCVERTIIDAKCPHCGKPPPKEARQTKDRKLAHRLAKDSRPELDATHLNGEAPPKPKRSYLVEGGI